METIAENNKSVEEELGFFAGVEEELGFFADVQVSNDTYVERESVGTLEEHFKNWTAKLLRFSKNGSPYACIVYKKLDEVTNKMVSTIVCIDQELTHYVRNHIIGMRELSRLPLSKSNGMVWVNSINGGFIAQESIQAVDWSPEAINYNKLGSAI